jgi:hypothetical protein
MTWQKGQSGNPEGRRLGKPVTDAIGQELAMLADGRVDPVPARSLRAAIRAQLAKAAKGNLASLAWLAERIEGKVATVVAGDAANPIAFAVTHHEEAERARAHIASELARMHARSMIVEGEVVEDTDAKVSE